MKIIIRNLIEVYIYFFSVFLYFQAVETSYRVYRSLIFIIGILLLSGFIDRIYKYIQQDIEQFQLSIQQRKRAPFIVILWIVSIFLVHKSGFYLSLFHQFGSADIFSLFMVSVVLLYGLSSHVLAFFSLLFMIVSIQYYMSDAEMTAIHFATITMWFLFFSVIQGLYKGVNRKIDLIL